MAEKPDLWMPLYLGSYIADTLRFTTEQHGAYLLIIMDYWRNGPPPDDNQVLAQISKLALARWKAHRVVIAPKFQIANGVWKHKRIEHELGRARGMQEALSERGKAGAAARWSKDSPSNATGTASCNANGGAQALLADAPRPLPGPLQTPGPAPGPSPLPKGNPVAGVLRPPTGKTVETWSAYSAAYQRRYGVEPVRNAKVNGQLAGLVDRLGASEAPMVAGFYLTHSGALYVRAKHPTNLLLQDAEGLRTEWLTGRKVTDTEARNADRTQATGDVFGRLIEEAGHGD